LTPRRTPSSHRIGVSRADLLRLDTRWIDGNHFLQFGGLRDGRAGYFDELLRVIEGMAVRAPGSYETIHYHDDNDVRGFSNEFRVLALVRGRLTEHADPILSPVIPTIEDKIELDGDDDLD
jgi:hypothetical protein